MKRPLHLVLLLVLPAFLLGGPAAPVRATETATITYVGAGTLGAAQPPTLMMMEVGN